MITLKSDEARVLGVMVEKAQTTPAQYPMTVNGIVTGCNQKSNRDPVVSYDEDIVLDALDSLRNKKLVLEVHMSNSRAQKFRHVAREAWDIGTKELVLLTELLLRGPQTVGELRGRASRMHALESLEVVSNVLLHLAEQDEPMVKRLPPLPGSRAERWVQLVCPNLHPLNLPPSGSVVSATSQASSTPSESTTPASGSSNANEIAELKARIETLESTVSDLQQTLSQLTG